MKDSESTEGWGREEVEKEEEEERKGRGVEGGGAHAPHS